MIHQLNIKVFFYLNVKNNVQVIYNKRNEHNDNSYFDLSNRLKKKKFIPFTIKEKSN